MTRNRCFQKGSLFIRGTRKKVWVARWWEPVIGPDNVPGRIRRSEVLGTVAEIGTKREAMRMLDDLLCHLDEVDRVIAAMSDNQAQRSLRHQADLNRQALLKASHELSLQIQQMGSFCGLMHGAIATRPCGPTTH